MLYLYANDAILLLDRGLHVVDCNQRALEFYGYRRDEMMALSLMDLRGDDAAITPAERAALLGCAGSTVFESSNRRKDGSTIWVEASARMIEDGMLVLAIIRDIGERRLAQRARRDSEQRFERALENVPDMVVVYDAELHVDFINGAADTVMGRAGADRIGRFDSVFWPPEIHEACLPTLEAARADKSTHTVEVRVSLPQVGPRHLRITCAPLTDEAGEIREILAIAHDLTERMKAETDVRLRVEQLSRVVEGAVFALGQTVEFRDPYTASHSRRAAALAVAIGESLGVRGDALTGLRFAGLVHDVGMIVVPAGMLSRPAKLGIHEFALVKLHPQAGHDILAPIEFDLPVAQIVLQHHERLDGSGYPQGLSGDEILLEARILAVADVVAAMSSHRPHRPAFSIDAALAEIASHRGVLYEPDAVDVCVGLFRERGFSFPDA